MCFSAVRKKKELPYWRELLFKCHPDKKVIYRTLGTKIIQSSDNFTTVLQPLVIDERIVYGITSYGSEELIIVKDGDDYPISDEYPLPGEENDGLFMPEVFPDGFRKAFCLETAIHLENVRKYHLENVDAYTKLYFPDDPWVVYKRAIKKEKRRNTRLGRLWERFYNAVFD